MRNLLKNAKGKQINVCIATSTYHPGPNIKTFVAYHLDLGIRKIYLFFDDPADPAIRFVEKISEVVVIRNDANLHARRSECSLYGKLRAHLSTEIMARQVLNVQVAIDLARQDGMDWILHIDDDELFYLSSDLQSHFQEVPESVGMLIYPNHEAAPEVEEIENFFEEVTLFKTNGGSLSDTMKAKRPYFFIGYQNGKSAGRISGSLLPGGAHRFSFKAPQKHYLEIPSTMGCVYHFHTCGLSRLISKHKRLGNFSDDYFGAPSPGVKDKAGSLKTKVLGFMVDARDAMMSAGEPGLKKLYQEVVQYSNPLEVKTLIKSGALHRNYEILERLKAIKKRLKAA